MKTIGECDTMECSDRVVVLYGMFSGAWPPLRIFGKGNDMKKTIAFLLALLLLFVTAACGNDTELKPFEEKHNHRWENATCTEAKTCGSCGETEGEALGHKWLDATCTDAKTCERCGETEGKALGHSWIDATCTEAKTCAVCGAVNGEPAGHKWTALTCTEAKTCEICGAVDGKAAGHTWLDATCTEAKLCEVCGAVEGEPSGHSWLDASCTEAKTCTICGETEGEAAGHAESDWIIDEEATCESAGSRHTVCTVCGVELAAGSIPQKEHTYGEWTVEAPAQCDRDGLRSRICSACSHKETEAIPATGHEKNTLISAEEIGGEFFGIWLCGMCGENLVERYEPLTATFEKSFTFSGNYPLYSVYVTAAGGLGKYEYQYVVYNKFTGKIIDTLYTDENAITFTDYNNYPVYMDTLAVRVYIIDAFGEVAYDFNLNDGNFGSQGILHYAYRLNGGTFSGVDYQG